MANAKSRYLSGLNGFKVVHLPSVQITSLVGATACPIAAVSVDGLLFKEVQLDEKVPLIYMCKREIIRSVQLNDACRH